MMKKYRLFILIVSFLCGNVAFAQQDATQLQDNAKAFMLEGDYSNAILLLNKAQQLRPKDIEITKDIALNYFLEKDNDKAYDIIKPLLDREDADEQCYQIAGNIYKEMNAPDECDKMYKKGLKRFPKSGPLYNDYGELLSERHDSYNAIIQWEKGIQVDPGYSKNYYNACKFYYLTGNSLWCILYAETFVDMEPLNPEGPEVKEILLDSYKKLFSNTDLLKATTDKNKFALAVLETLNKQNEITMSGITTETLTMIRTRFILEWFKNYADKYPFRVFDYQRQLLQTGMFDAYSQSLFGTVQNLSAYQNWANTHTEEYNAFDRFQRGRTFKVPSGQYYK